MHALVTYLKNVRAEMAHVVWPTRSQTIWYTIIIVLISAILALFIAGLDYLFTAIVSKVVAG